MEDECDSWEAQVYPPGLLSITKLPRHAVRHANPGVVLTVASLTVIKMECLRNREIRDQHDLIKTTATSQEVWTSSTVVAHWGDDCNARNLPPDVPSVT